MRIKMLPGALVIAALVTLAISLGVATPNVYGGGDDSLPTLPEKPELKYPNLGSNLDQLVASVEEGETSAKEAAEDAPVHQEASVAVTIYLSGNVDDVVKFLEDNGGSPRNVGEDYIEAYVPVSLLGQVSERTGVIRVREIVPPEDNQSAQRVAGHGPPVHGSSAWNQAGFSGQGIKVGVIDSNFAFNDFMGLMGTELPSSVQARCYTDAGRFTSNVADCGNAILGDNHGTLLAEAVMDIAPEASLYIATVWSLGDLQTATDWMVSQGVSVIASGVVFNFDGPGDGTSPFSDSPLKTVDRAVAGGAIWVNGAGNYGQRTWFGTYSIVNVDGTKYVAFNGSDVFNDIALEVGDVITVQLRWEDSWSGANRDFDLLIWDFATSTIVDHSFDPQQGRVGQVPFELLSYQVPRDGRYAVVVVHEGGSTPGWIQLTVWGVGSIEHYTESGSIANPAESSNPGMLAVGAAHWNKVRTIEHYSSRGPTPDRRVKPDIVGADCGATALRNGFCGTSQAAPHVAGMAALVRQRFPTYTAVQVANYLKEHADQRESPDPNNTWGHGFAQLPPLSGCSDAVPSAASNPGLVADCEALLAARDTLPSSGTLNWSGSTAIASWDGVTIDGSPLRVTSLVLSDSQLTGTIPPELGNITNLEILSLTRNQLTGPIPVGLGSLTNLRELSLGENQLTGMIPAELGSLTKLDWLYLSGNQLSGEVPSSLGSLTKLDWLYLSDNQLSGEIPTELGNITNLEELYLWGNQLTGPIPASLGGLANLEQLSLSQNQLSGAIPTELGSLANLQGLWVYRNQLSGSVPTWLGSLANLQVLDLSQNQLSGAIPTELGSLSKLQVLHLYNNQLSGEIPSELGSLANLRFLSLSQNQLSGAIPTELGSLTNLADLFLGGNQLTGCIPVGIADVANNDLSQLGLPFCAGASGDPTIGTLTPGADFLTITWAAPTGSTESAIIAYDLRYIRTDADETADSNWTVLEDVWTTGPDPLEYTITGLTDGTQYDVQLRAVNSAGTGPWSATATGATTVLAVVFSDLHWTSAQLQNHIARHIVENGYGYPTIAVSDTTLQALRDGDSHVMMEIWPAQLSLVWDEARESGEVFSPGTSLGNDWRSAFVIPAYLQAQHPGLDSVEDLKDQRYKDLFKTAETGGKARLVSCVIGWDCAGVNAEQVEAYGLADHVHMVNPISGQALDASLNDAYEKQEPWLGFQWGTSDPALLLDLVRLEEPEYSDECWLTTKACAYEDSTILIGVNSSLPDLAPDVVEFLRHWDFSIDVHLRSVVRWLDSNPEASREDAALHWLGSNVDVWSGWVTGEAAAGVLATLPATSIAPSVNVTGSADALVRLNSLIHVMATFSEPVSGFVVEDIVVGYGTVSNFAGSGAVYTFDVTPNTIGEVTVDIPAGVAEDADGYGNMAAHLSLGITYDDDGDGAISRNEVLAAITDYFADRITRDEVLGVITLYFAS